MGWDKARNRILMIVAIVVVCAMASMGAWRSAQVYQLGSVVAEQEAYINVQSVELHERLEAMQQKDDYMATLYVEAKRVVYEIYEQLQICDRYYRQCIAERSAALDNPGGDEG